jgi:polysaccharide deacetylase 2 family uncharacterized protein YibQ
MKALAVAAGIVFWTLVLGVAVLMFFPAGEGGEPVAVLQVESAPPAPAAPAPTTGNMDLPPGFSVTGPSMAPGQQPAAPSLAPPGQGTTIMPSTPSGMPAPPPPPGPNGALETPEGEKIAAADLPAGIDRTGQDQMVEVPVPALVEDSPYGPLPKVASDGRRPADVYARPSHYANVVGGPPRVAVLLNGLGVPGAPEGDVIKGLPPPVSIGYGAYGRGLQERVTQAREEGHEVLLAIPLEPDDYPAEDPGPHTLLTTLPTNENIKRLQWLMSRYTGYAGVTNYMGAKFERTPDALRPVLAEVKRRGLLYLDDGSVEGSAAPEIAKDLELEYATAQINLESGSIDKSLAELEASAKSQGAAIGIAKAEEAAVKKIADWAGTLADKGLVLVPVSAAMRAPRPS